MVKKFLIILGLSILFILVIDIIFQLFRSARIEPREVHFYGDSTIMNGMDDSDERVGNYAESAESYRFTYLKLERNINHGNVPRSVYIGFSEHNILSLQNPWYINPTDIYARTVRYLPFSIGQFTMTEIKELDKYLVAEVRKFFTKGLVFSEGGYEPNISGNFEDGFSFEFLPGNEIDSVQFFWLKEAVSLAKQNNAQVILLRCPVFGEHETIREFRDVLNYFEGIDVTYQDMNDSLAWPKALFRDRHHLNAKGSDKMTNAILDFEK